MEKKRIALNVVAIGGGDGEVPEWVPLIPAGLIEGRDGRRWRNSSPQKILDHFASLGRELPVDVEHASEHKAPKGEPAPAFGWVEELEVREGAVWGRVSWNSAGQQMIGEKQYRYLSPVILYTPKDGEIVGLTSVGLTNQPNFHLPALNQQQGATPEEETMYKVLMAALGLSETATEAEAVARVKALGDDVQAARNRADNPDLEKFVPRADYDAAVLKAENAQRQLDTIKLEQREEAIEVAIDAALAEGKITPATREYHTAQCRQEGGLDRFKEFCKSAPVIGGESGLDKKQPGDGGKALNAEETQVCAMLGIDESEYQKTEV